MSEHDEWANRSEPETITIGGTVGTSSSVVGIVFYVTGSIWFIVDLISKLT